MRYHVQLFSSSDYYEDWIETHGTEIQIISLIVFNETLILTYINK